MKQQETTQDSIGGIHPSSTVPGASGERARTGPDGTCERGMPCPTPSSIKAQKSPRHTTPAPQRLTHTRTTRTQHSTTLRRTSRHHPTIRARGVVLLARLDNSWPARARAPVRVHRAGRHAALHLHGPWGFPRRRESGAAPCRAAAAGQVRCSAVRAQDGVDGVRRARSSAAALHLCYAAQHRLPSASGRGVGPYPRCSRLQRWRPAGRTVGAGPGRGRVDVVRACSAFDVSVHRPNRCYCCGPTRQFNGRLF